MSVLSAIIAQLPAGVILRTALIIQVCILVYTFI